jgi:hypothetical protein
MQNRRLPAIDRETMASRASERRTIMFNSLQIALCRMCACPERLVEGILQDNGRKETASFQTTYHLSERHRFRTLSAHRARPDLGNSGSKARRQLMPD